MEIISDIVDDNGMHHLVVRYTEEEKVVMEQMRAKYEAAHAAPKAAKTKKASKAKRKQSA